MAKAGATSGDDPSLYATHSPDGGITLGLSELDWETKFFGRRFGRLEIDEEGKGRV